MYKIGKSDIEGEGVFADQDISKGTCLGLAHVMKGLELIKITDLGAKHNHSKEPNCRSVKINEKRYLFAIRDLQKGEEITVDYTLQPELEQPKPEWDMQSKETLVLLDHEGKPQSKLHGTELVFSRISSKKILDLAEKAKDGNEDALYKLGEYAYKERMAQRKRDGEA